MKRTLLAASFAALAITPAFAQQTTQRTWPVSELEAACNRSGNAPAGACAATASHARARYGDRASAYQWNAAIGVVRNQLRQGKL